MGHVETAPALASQATTVRDGSKGEGKARTDRIRIEQHGGWGMLWLAGWLFSIGFLNLGFWKGFLALLVWPYFIGTTVAALVAR